MNWDNIKEFWFKNGCPSSYRLQNMLSNKGITKDDGNIRAAIRKWRDEIDSQFKNFNWKNKGENLWNKLEEESEEYILYHQQEPHKLFESGENLPIGIVNISDQHFGNIGTDYKKAKEDAKLIGKTEGLYAIDGGDSADNHINTKIMPAIINSKVPPIDQISLLKVYYKWLNNKLIAKISGNHEFWTKKYAGIDFYDVLKPDVIVPSSYSRHEAKVTIFVGDIEYRIMIRHKFRYNSSFNLTHTVKRMWEHSDWDFDIGVVCHGHVPSIEPFYRHGKEIWAIRPGSYMVKDEYAMEMGYYGTQISCPTCILYPDRKTINVIKDLRPAILLLQAERKKYK